MKFKQIHELDKAIEQSEIFNHQIKGKRIRKELQNLSEIDQADAQIDEFELNDVAIKIFLNVHIDEKVVKFIIRLDNQYPFNQPQLFYGGTDLPKLKKCKDLLCQLLNQQVWGPSLTLQTFIKQINPLAKKILSEPENINWMYHTKFEYGRQELEESGVKLFDVEEYEWKYMIKTTKKKVIGITDECLMKFIESDGKYILDWYSLISELKDIKAMTGKNKNKKSKFELNITHKEQQKDKITYLGGDSTELDNILSLINPIQMMERKIQLYEKSQANYDDALEVYTELVDHYSQVDPEKTAKLIQSMKKMIEKQYNQPKPKLQEVEHAEKIET